jgi:diguanylate cyclase
VGVEALVRWQHPERGLLFPAAFIDTAEQTGAIVELGAFVLRESLQQCAAWRQAGHDLYVSVNLSGSQLADTSLTSLIAASPLPEGQVWLEVTETSLVGDVARAGEILTSLTQLGAKISIDDFGTGWASMTYLREFPVHALKIDRSFVSGLGASEIDTAIATSVLSLGRELGLKVFAEGIETDTQHQRLRDLGCEYGQGYLFGRPVPPEQLALEA